MAITTDVFGFLQTTLRCWTNRSRDDLQNIITQVEMKAGSIGLIISAVGWPLENANQVME